MASDRIKTGYTDASGYNLVSSVWRNERHIVAVVLGGTSNAARDARMRQLIEEHIPAGLGATHGADRCRGQGTGQRARHRHGSRAHVRAGVGAQQAGPAHGAEAAGPGCKARG